MSYCSFVLLFHNLCYTHIKMENDSLPEARASWLAWAEFLRRRGLDGLVVWALEAASPLTVLGAQALYFGGLILRPARAGSHDQQRPAQEKNSRTRFHWDTLSRMASSISANF